VASVREFIEGNAPETYKAFTAMYDGGDRPEIVGQRIDSYKDRLFVAGTNVEGLDEFVKSYFADIVTLDLIPTWLDFIQHQMRRSDGVAAGPGFEGLGGESSLNYDRVDGLQKVRDMIARRVASSQEEFLAAASGVLRTQIDPSEAANVIRTSSDGERLLTPDPEPTFRHLVHGNRVLTGPVWFW